MEKGEWRREKERGRDRRSYRFEEGDSPQSNTEFHRVFIIRIKRRLTQMITD